MRNVRFLWASEEIDKRADQYWTQVMEIARCFTITRYVRGLAGEWVPECSVRRNGKHRREPDRIPALLCC